LFSFAFVPNFSDLIRLLIHTKNPSTFHLSPYRQGLDNPLIAMGAEICFLVCRGWRRGGERTSFWFDTLVLNWGKYFAACYIILSASRNHQRETSISGALPGRIYKPSRSISGAVAGEASSSSTRFLFTNLISPHLHYLPFASGFPLPHFTICLSFSSLPLHQFAVLFAPLFRSPFSC
jgi:hypothetical protein